MRPLFSLMLTLCLIGTDLGAVWPAAAQSTVQSSTNRQLLLLSTPSDADVFIEGKPVGKTPYAGQLPPGTYQVRVSKDQYTLWEQHVSLREDQRILIQLGRQRGGRAWLWAVTGLVVAGGGAGGALALLKKKQTGQPGNQGNSDLPSAPPGHP